MKRCKRRADVMTITSSPNKLSQLLQFAPHTKPQGIPEVVRLAVELDFRSLHSWTRPVSPRGFNPRVLLLRRIHQIQKRLAREVRVPVVELRSQTGRILIRIARAQFPDPAARPTGDW